MEPTVREWLRVAELRLQVAGVDAPRLEAQVLAAHVLRVGRAWLFAHPEAEFPSLAGESVLQRRERGEPLAYIVGRREFYGLEFRVTPAVLIPRQDTEILVEAALRYGGPSARVLDIGTGSGAIAVSLKLTRPGWDVVGVDISEDALEIARENASRLGAEVEFVLSDLGVALAGRTFDLIVTNPPYIGHDEPLAHEVRGYEPALALFADEDGYAVYRRLAEEVGDLLAPDGRLLMEVGYRQAAQVGSLFVARGWTLVETIPDLAGIARVVVVKRADSVRPPEALPQA